MKKLVGIIGGAGVAATNKLLEIIENTLTKNGAFRDCHHPEMVVYQATLAPSRSMFLEGKGENFFDDYATVGKKLKSIGATKLCMCCNTAHYSIFELEKAIGLPFINLIDSVIDKAAASKYKNVALIASDGCLLGQVYEKSLERKQADINFIYPDKNVQQLVTKGICNIKNRKRFQPDDEENPVTIFSNIDKFFAEKGVDAIIWGCTDISVVSFPTMCQSIDSLHVLAEKIIEEYNS